jgi:hypothetical protein
MSDDNVTQLPAPRRGAPMPAGDHSLVKPPVLSRMRALEEQVASALELSRSIFQSESPASPWNDAAKLRQRLEAVDPVALRQRLEGAQRPADERERAVLISYLAAATLMGNNRDEEYLKVLHEEIAEVSPSLGALARAVRKLVRSEEWTPSIPRMLDAIEAAESRLKAMLREMDDIAERQERGREQLRYLERTPEEVERDERLETERKIEHCVRLIHKSGDDHPIVLGSYNGEILREAQRRIAEANESQVGENIPF